MRRGDVEVSGWLPKGNWQMIPSNASYFYGRKWAGGFGTTNKKQGGHPLFCSRPCGTRDVGEECATLIEDHRGSSVLREEPVKAAGERDNRKKGSSHFNTEFQMHNEELKKKVLCIEICYDSV